MSTVEERRRVAELVKLSKSELVCRCKAAGSLGPNLERWSKHDLAVQAARCEQRVEVSA